MDPVRTPDFGSHFWQQCVHIDKCFPFVKQVVWGELSEALLDQLSALSSEVFLPLLSNRTNTEKVLPEVVAKSVTDGLQRFAATGNDRCALLKRI